MFAYRKLNNWMGWLIWLIATMVYLLTMEAGASWWDCGEFIAATYKLQVVHPPGAPIFLMVGRIFSLFASSPEQVPVMTNIFSALSTSFSILFCFWIITRLAKKMIAGEEEEPDSLQKLLIIGSGVVGALTCTFLDSVWFSAVESEVYALATFFFALIFWAMIKWEEMADTPKGDRWIIFIFLTLGLSMGVHLLSLLAIPAMGMIYYFKNYTYTRRGLWLAILINLGILVFVLFGVLDKFIAIAAAFDRALAGIGMGVGIAVFTLILAGLVFYGVRYAIQKNKRTLYIGLMSFTMMMIGLSSYAMVLVRAHAEPPINMNGINDVHSFLSYLKREQYGSRDLVYGTYWTAQPLNVEYGKEKWGRKPGGKEYVPIGKEFKLIYDLPDAQLAAYGMTPQQIQILRGRNKKVIFPRMGSPEGRHAGLYYNFANVPDDQQNTYIPSYGTNLNFFFTYQMGYMYWRYFMWNFSGRQNDSQGFYAEAMKDGNWITGIEGIDKLKNPNIDRLPQSQRDLKSRNVFYMLPFIIGLLGMVYQLKKDWKGFLVVFMFFFFMGIMNLVNSNQPPVEPRERDYALVGAFFAFAIWVGFGVLALFDMAKSNKNKLTEYLLYMGILMVSFFITGLTVYDLDSFIALLFYTAIVTGIMYLLVLGARMVTGNWTGSAVVALLLCLSAPLLMGFQGWDDHDRSNRTMARDFARNYLESCPPNAILFTQGDNDTYPLWYAQEVEGIRTDVRIINMSLLGVDWYINHLRHATNDAGVVDLLLDQDKVFGDKRNSVRYNDKSKFRDRELDLKDMVLFMGSDKAEALDADGDNYLPSLHARVTVDSAAVADKDLVPEHLKGNITTIHIDINNKTLLKNDLMVLDIIAGNINKRPICFAITVSPDAYMGAEKYFMQTGMVYRLTPVEIDGRGMGREVGEEVTYDLLINHAELFTYGGIERHLNMNLDPSSLGSAMTAKYVMYQQLAANLVQDKLDKEAQAALMRADSSRTDMLEVAEGLEAEAAQSQEMAVTVLNKMMEQFPEEVLPYDYNMVNAASYYQILGETEQSLKIVRSLSETVLDDLAYFYYLYNKPADGYVCRSQYAADQRDAERCVGSLINIARKDGDSELSDSIKKRWEMLQAEFNIRTNAPQQAAPPAR